jgi:hypothetical protein
MKTKKNIFQTISTLFTLKTVDSHRIMAQYETICNF